MTRWKGHREVRNLRHVRKVVRCDVQKHLHLTRLDTFQDESIVFGGKTMSCCARSCDYVPAVLRKEAWDLPPVAPHFAQRDKEAIKSRSPPCKKDVFEHTQSSDERATCTMRRITKYIPKSGCGARGIAWGSNFDIQIAFYSRVGTSWFRIDAREPMVTARQPRPQNPEQQRCGRSLRCGLDTLSRASLASSPLDDSSSPDDAESSCASA